MRCLAPFSLLALALVPSAALADPLPVHTATGLRPRELREIPAAQRLQAADAVAEALGAVAPEVLSGQETRSRLQTLVPDALSCDAPACVPSIATPLHARGVVLLRLSTPRHGRVRVWVGLVSPAGEVSALQEAEEAVAGWPEAVALVRETARPLVEALRQPAPSTPVAASAAPAPTPGSPRAAPPSTQPPPSVEQPVETYRRTTEAALGAGLLAVGVTLATTGLVSVSRDGSVAESLPNNVDSVYVAGARDYVLLGLGTAAAVAGVVLVIDGLRTRTRPVPTARVTPGVSLTAQGPSFVLGGRF